MEPRRRAIAPAALAVILAAFAFSCQLASAKDLLDPVPSNTTEASTAAVLPAAVLDRNGCIKAGTFNPKVNYFSRVFRGQPFAKGGKNTYLFSVRYKNYYKVVKDLFAGTTYVLYQCGAQQPSLGTGPVYLQIPLKAYGVTDDASAPYLQMLGVQRALKSSPPGTMVEPCMQKLTAKLPAPNSALPVFAGYVDSTLPLGMNISFSNVYDYSPMRRTEWIKYLSLFFNKEELANRAFLQMYNSYSCNRRRAAAVKTKPRVVWINYYAGVWTLSSAPYKTKFVRDAGGANPPQVSKGDVNYNMSNPEQAAAFQYLLQFVNVALDESYLPAGPAAYSVSQFKTYAQLTEAQAAGIPFLRSNNLWTTYGQYSPTTFSTGWYEGGVAYSQVVLQELVAIVKPLQVYPKSFKHTYFANVAFRNARAVTAGSCRAKRIYAAVTPSRAGC